MLISCSMTSDFAQWLQDELDERKMKPVDLANLAGKDQGMISRILRRQRMPTPDTLNAIAKALRLPSRIVFEAAGQLPPEKNNDLWVEEMSHKLGLLPTEMRGPAGRLIDALIEGDESEESEKRSKPKPKVKPSSA